MGMHYKIIDFIIFTLIKNSSNYNYVLSIERESDKSTDPKRDI